MTVKIHNYICNQVNSHKHCIVEQYGIFDITCVYW